jgi:hypothetical protein
MIDLDHDGIASRHLAILLLLPDRGEVSCTDGQTKEPAALRIDGQTKETAASRISI